MGKAKQLTMGYVIKKRKRSEPLAAGQHWEEVKPEFWFEWGDEPRGYVSTGYYDKWGNYHYTGLEPISVKQLLPFKNPHA